PPVLACPANVTIQCTANTLPASQGFATATDNCDAFPNITYSDATVAGTCAQQYRINRTWMAADDCGNTSTCIQTIDLVDNSNPTITCPPDITIQCGTSTAPSATGTPTSIDNCGTPSFTFSDATMAGSCPQSYTILRTWTASDGCGNTNTCIQSIFITDSTIPSISCPANVTIQCGTSTLPAATGSATANDNCSSPLVTFADVTAAGSCSQAYSITRTWTAIDGCGNTNSCVQSITVRDNTPPVITCPANVTIQCTSDTSPGSNGMATATDNCDPAPAVSFTDATMARSCPQEYSINRTWQAADACGNTSTCIQTITLIDNVAPVISCPANVTINCTANTLPVNTGSATATDNCDGAPMVTYSDASISGSCPQAYSITRTWMAIDHCGNSSTCTQSITVKDVQAPSISCPANITIQCNTDTSPASTGTATSTDNCDSTPAVSFTDVTASGTCPQAYTITRTWHATDDCGNASTCNQIIRVVDSTAPVLTCPGDVTIECDESSLPGNTGNATATDACDGSLSIFYEDYLDTPPGASPEMRWVYLPAGAMIGSCTSATNCQTGTICFGLQYTPGLSGTLTSYTTGFLVDCYNNSDPVISNASCVMSDNSNLFENCGGNSLILMNCSGNSGSLPVTQNIPVILHQVCYQLGPGANILVDEDETTNLTTSVNVAGIGQVTEAPAYTNFQADFDAYCSGGCPYPRLVYRKFIAQDDCGNAGYCVQQITIEDTTPPTLTCPANVTVLCTASTLPANTGNASATDNCEQAPLISYADITAAGSCPQAYSISRTWNASDGCGNSSTCVQIITVIDNVNPVINCPADITIQCTDNTLPPNTGSATASDNCSGTPTISFNDVTASGTCPQAYLISRTWTAIDDCGNAGSCTQTIYVIDNVAPAISCPTDITIQCTATSDPANTGAATSSDNCDGTPVITYSDVTVAGSCPQAYFIQRT
ncbi:MAG TPA: hypothetical protein VJ508_11580, partial [Saprospiraceae bacterium]|nr:hypothetical protein [Saprospiraceae bacterium]